MADRKRATIFYGGFAYRGGGVVNHARLLCDEMLRDGWDARLISLEKLPLPLRFLPHVVSKVVNFAAAPMGLYYKDRLTGFLYRQLFDRDEELRIFEDVYLTWNSTVPSVTVLHAVWSDNIQSLALSPSATRRLIEAEERTIDAIAHPIITVSDRYRESLTKSHGGSRRVHDLEVIPLGLDVSQFESADAGVRHAKSLVFCGNLEARKNLAFLLAVFQRLHAVDPDWRLTLIGDGPDRSKLEGYARQHALPVAFRGRISRPDVIAELARHTLYVHPSVKESFSFALLEAKLSGLKTIAYRDLEVPEEFVDIPVATFGEDDWLRAILAAGEVTRKPIETENYSASRMMERTVRLALASEKGQSKA